MINKTKTKKLNKALALAGSLDTRRYIGKSGAGLWYVGRLGMQVGGFPDNMYDTADEAIDAALGGFWPEVLRVV